jgi:NADH-quinone oxidoreductase subunit G
MPLEESMIKIQIDGKFYDVKQGKNLLEVSLSLGFNIPYFCYHPAMGSVGACRQCAVKKYKDENDKKGKIVMSCMEPVVDGLIVSIEDEEVRNFRKLIIESLMTNHPHDCPVCDEGGECHLQDMTVMTQHNYRRFQFKKRTYKNQYLGPFLKHEMNRCIQCYRCVRFYTDYAGGNDLNVFAAHNSVYFGRHEDGVLENEFSGNLAEVCPTGVFTDKTLSSHYTRKWDLTNAPSVCVNCSVGCNTIGSERYNYLRRIVSRYNGAVNGYFLCDRGRFGYQFVNDEKRIKKIKIRSSRSQNLEDAQNDNFLNVLFSGNKKIIGIGSPRASVEANYALSVLVGNENFYQGISKKDYNLTKIALNILKTGPVRSPSLKDMEKADAVFIVGEDVTNTAPMVALALRQAARTVPKEMAMKSGIPQWHDNAVRDMSQGLKSPIFIATSYKTKLDDLAQQTYRASSSDIARLSFAVAYFINNEAPQVTDLEDTEKSFAENIAKALKEAKNPLIISGVHSGDESMLYASANIALALSVPGKKTLLSFVFPECNSAGLGMMEGKPLEEALTDVEKTEADILLVLENDLYRRANRKTIDQIFEKSRQIVVLDHLINETTKRADVLLPAGTFAESEGTFVNNEGRAQKFYNILPVKEPIKESWRWLRDIMRITNNKEGILWEHYEDVVSAMVNSQPEFSLIKQQKPEKDFMMLNEKIPRQTIRYSGRTANLANINVSEQQIPSDTETPFAFSMEGYKGKLPSSLISYYWQPGWNSYQAMNFYLEEPNGPLKDGDPGIRLIETKDIVEMSYYSQIPAAFKKKQDEFMIVPVYHIFGSEELSSKGAAIKERIPEPGIFLSRKDAEKFKTTDTVQLNIMDYTMQIRKVIDESLPEGIAGLSYNLPGMPYLVLPGWGRISPSSGSFSQ